MIRKEAATEECLLLQPPFLPGVTIQQRTHSLQITATACGR